MVLESVQRALKAAANVCKLLAAALSSEWLSDKLNGDIFPEVLLQDVERHKTIIEDMAPYCMASLYLDTLPSPLADSAAGQSSRTAPWSKGYIRAMEDFAEAHVKYAADGIPLSNAMPRNPATVRLARRIRASSSAGMC